MSLDDPSVPSEPAPPVEGRPSPRVLGVAELLLAASDALQTRLGAVSVCGELSGFTRAASGHCYFTLKDADGANAVLRCAMFRRAAALLEFAPRDGQHVEVRGRVLIYEPRGELQCVVEALLPRGAGSMYELFLRQRARLQAAGLFDAGRKRPIQKFPRALGVISSTAGAALHDVLTTLARRAPHVRVIVYPSAVQGPDAPSQLVRALQQAGQRAEVDTLIVCRGGGSIEDLWSFNDEAVVRAIAGSAVPVVCGIGHETDVTLADLAADLRAPTPTAAAELAAPVRDELLLALDGATRRVERAMRQRLDRASQQLDWLAARLTQNVGTLQPQHHRLERLAQRARYAWGQRYSTAMQTLAHTDARWQRACEGGAQHRGGRLDVLADRLAQLDPQRVLSRGYALIETDAAKVVTTPSQLRVGQRLRVSLARGAADVVPGSVQERLPERED